MSKLLSFASFPRPRGATPAARRRALARLSPTRLADEFLAPLALELRAGSSASHRALARFVGLPVGEVLASPFALRLSAMAAADGVTTVQRELRREAPEGRAGSGRARGTDDPDHGTWSRGRLALGKYQMFACDEPFATFHPDHGSKWGPHELCHRAMRFHWRADMTPWELYLGARLNELVPVVTWYGLEEAMRLEDAGRFDRERTGERPGAPLKDARWRSDDEAQVRARARADASLVLTCLDHFERELAAIDEEIATGTCVRVRHPWPDARTLDASSDALSYAVHNHERLTAKRVCEAREDIETEGRDYFESVRTYRDFVEARFDALLFEPIEVDLGGHSVQERARRELRDLVMRAAYGGAKTWRAMRKTASQGVQSLGGLREALGEELGPRASIVLHTGLPGRADTFALDQLGEGLASCVPRALALADADLSAMVLDFASSQAFIARAPLARRFAAFLGEGELHELAHLEAMIADAGRGDDALEHLSARDAELPAELEGVVVVANTVFEHARFEQDVVALHAGSSDAASGLRDVLVGAHEDAASVLPVPADIAKSWTALRRKPRDAQRFVATLRAKGLRTEAQARAWLTELTQSGAVGWRRDAR